MRNRIYHTSVNLLLDPATYQRIKMIARLRKMTMSKIIREGIKLFLAQYDRENNSITIENATDLEKIGDKS